VWIQNSTHTWDRLHDGLAVQPAEDTELLLTAIPAGSCHVEWRDTWQGVVVRQSEARADNGQLRIPLPSIPRDLAFKLRFGG
jgi:hypothetical protein